MHDFNVLRIQYELAYERQAMAAHYGDESTADFWWAIAQGLSADMEAAALSANTEGEDA